MPTTQDIVQKLWNLCNILKDDGVTYQDYVTELTYLLFLKMAQETGIQDTLPKKFRWAELETKNEADMLTFYRGLLLHLGTEATHEQQARSSLAQLVAHVFTHQNGPIQGLTYEDLATRIGRVNKDGVGHAHGMGQVLAVMGHLLQGLEGNWGEPIPHIQSLVIKKTGTNRGLPDDGIKEFWPGYPVLTRPEKENRTQAEYQNILTFGSRWNDVLAKLNIQPVVVTKPQKYFGKGGESEAHKALKEYVRTHPELVGADASWNTFTEYALPPLDEIDLLFKSAVACIAVEVKSAISDHLTTDYERGLYQTVKYRALLEAMSKDRRYDMPANIRVVLVLESKLPVEYKSTAEVLGVELIENVQIPKPLKD
jgi:hypothetical protein